MMDRELAEAVLERWNAGDPVSEMGLYKAAQALGIDPQAALAEARFHTYVDSYLLEKRAMSGAERIVFSAAAGFDAGSMTKTASVHGLSPDELIIEALRERNFVPDLSKIAMIAPPMDPMAAQGGGQPPAGDPSMGDPAALQQAAGAAMMQPPQPGAQLQQQPSARVRPTPTAPEQIAPSEMGNIEELLAMSQQANPGMADAGGGVPPAGAPEAQPQPMDPVSRIMQVGPNLDQETASRYAEQLQRFEEGFGMQISDPKQMVKFVKELQKVDGKKVDQGIKAMGQQLEQEQAQELGIDGGVPTIDGGGGPQVMAPKPGGEQPGQGGPPGQQKPGGAGPQGQAPGQAEQPGSGPEEPAAQQVAEEMAAGGKPPPGKMPPRPPQKQGPQQAAPQQAAVEKVAHAARVLARATTSTR
jgi:hypothetical protein